METEIGPKVLERGSEEAHRATVRHSITEGSRLTAPYMVMNGLATAVASYGLMADSTAVVIGAMIIAMLLGPILGLALSLVDGDTKLLRTAIIAEIAGVVLVVLVGGLVGRLHFDIPLTNEIFSRTTPNLLDLAIALFGGAAGAYASVTPRIGVGLVGVAISTALVPPLATCGICLSRGHFDLAGGAFILFATNLVAIQCASSFVLYVFGYHQITKPGDGDPSYVRRLVVDAAILLVLTVFLYRQLAATIQNQQFQRLVATRLERGLLEIPGAHLVETRYVDRKDRLVIVAVVRAPNSVTPDQVARLQSRLGTQYGRPIELHVRSLFTKEATADGYLHVIEPEALPIERLQEPVTQLESTIEGDYPPDSSAASSDGATNGSVQGDMR